MWLWSLASAKSAEPEPMSQFEYKGWHTSVEPGKTNIPVWRPSERGILKGGSALCSCQAFNWLAKAHPPFGGQSALLSLPICMLISSKNTLTGLPWWLSGWESACQCRGHGFEPWSGKIPHAAEQLGSWATITEPAHLEPVLRNKRGRNSERPAHRDEECSPLATTRESPRTETKTQHGNQSINQ